MPARFKMEMEAGNQSWSEAYIHPTINDPSGIDARTTAVELSRRRGNMLGPGGTVFACIVSIPGDPGNAEDVDIGQGFTSPYPASGAGNSPVDGEMPNDSIMVSISGKLSGRTYKKKTYLGYPPEGQIKTINAQKVCTLNGQYQTDFNVFLNYLIDGGWTFAVGVEGSKIPVQVLGTQNAAPGLLTVTAPGLDGAAFAPGKKVHLRGFRVHPLTRKPLAGIYKVQSQPPAVNGLTTLALWGTQDRDPTLYTDAGTISSVTQGFCPIQFVIGTSPTTRDRGNAGSQPRGRARTKF